MTAAAPPEPQAPPAQWHHHLDLELVGTTAHATASAWSRPLRCAGVSPRPFTGLDSEGAPDPQEMPGAGEADYLLLGGDRRLELLER